MAVDFTRAPFPITYRELWLPRGINGNATLPSSRYNGHELAFTGARKGTTTDGGRFRGGATDNLKIIAHGDQQNKQAFHITIRFRFPEGYTVGDGDIYLFNWDNGGNDFIRLRFFSVDGKIYFEQGDPGVGQEFQLAGTLTSWVAGQWYTVTARLQDTPEQELYEDGVSVASSTVPTPVDTPAGGDIIIGNSTDGGINGALVDISFVLIGMGATAVVAITDNEATDLARGIPPVTTKVQYFFPMDEGRGVTITNRGDATGNGTLDTGVSWIWGQCKQPVISFDAHNDHAQTAATVVNISGDITIVWAGKIKCPYSGLVMGDHYLLEFEVDVNNFILLWYNLMGNDIRYMTKGGGGAAALCDFVFNPDIDDYAILITTLDSDRMVGYLNGYLNTQQLTISGPIVGLATGYVGREDALASYDPSKPLFIGLIDGAFTQKQALAYSRYLNEILHMGIVI